MPSYRFQLLQQSHRNPSNYVLPERQCRPNDAESETGRGEHEDIMSRKYALFHAYHV